MKRKRESFPSVEDMSGDAVAETPEDRDWSEGYSETWDYVAASRCEECGEIVMGVREGDYPTHAEAVRDNPPPDADEDAPECTCEGNVSGASPPMMSYLYRLPRVHDAEAAARAIVDLPLCIVTDGEGEIAGMALTGGGMDLSWEICEAYMRLGSLPPTHFRLPAMCGRGVSPKDRWIAEGCKRSIKVQIGWFEHGKEDIDRALAFGRRYEREAKARQKAAKAERAEVRS